MSKFTDEYIWVLRDSAGEFISAAETAAKQLRSAQKIWGGSAKAIESEDGLIVVAGLNKGIVGRIDPEKK